MNVYTGSTHITKEGYSNRTQAMEQIPGNIHFYNEERPHSSIGMLTPNQATAWLSIYPENGKVIINKKS